MAPEGVGVDPVRPPDPAPAVGVLWSSHNGPADPRRGEVRRGLCDRLGDLRREPSSVAGIFSRSEQTGQRGGRVCMRRRHQHAVHRDAGRLMGQKLGLVEQVLGGHAGVDGQDGDAGDLIIQHQAAGVESILDCVGRLRKEAPGDVHRQFPRRDVDRGRPGAEHTLGFGSPHPGRPGNQGKQHDTKAYARRTERASGEHEQDLRRECPGVHPPGTRRRCASEDCTAPGSLLQVIGIQVVEPSGAALAAVRVAVEDRQNRALRHGFGNRRHLLPEGRTA